MEILPPFSERNGNDTDDSVRIGGSLLKEAVKNSIDILDAATLEAIFAYLTKKGIDMNDQSSRYSLEQLEAAIGDIFGDEARSLIMERIRSWLKNNGH